MLQGSQDAALAAALDAEESPWATVCPLPAHLAMHTVSGLQDGARRPALYACELADETGPPPAPLRASCRRL